MTTLRFRSWVQPATGHALAGVDAADARPDAPAAADRPPVLQPALGLRETVGGGTLPVTGPDLDVLGPGGVVGIDPAAVLRRYPTPGATGAEAEALAAVELGPTDLPWRFTPARAGAADRLRPWLVLVVVPGATAVVPGVPADRMTVDVADLPDLAESWAWAHAQLDGDDPAHGRSRLLCPRRLWSDGDAADTPRAWRAALVPAFRGGVEAGLGMTVDPDRVGEPAWSVDTPGSVTLPVYDHWAFTTDAGGDFEALALRIQPAGAAVSGYRVVDVGAPWYEDAAPPVTLPVGGALRPLGAAPPTTTVTPAQVDALHHSLADAVAAGAGGDLAVPLRGGHHAHRTTIAVDGGDWVDQINREVAWRLAAADGAAWVRDRQEELMARAWEQAGAVRAANRVLALARAARTVTASLQARHLDTLSADELASVIAPSGHRARLDDSPSAPTVRATLDASPVADGLASTALARMARRALGRSGVVSRAVAGQLPPATFGTAGRGGSVADVPGTPQATGDLANEVTARAQQAHRTALAVDATSVWVATRATGTAEPAALSAALGDPGVFAGGPAAVADRIQAAAAEADVLAAIGKDRLASVATSGGPAPVTVGADGVRIAPDALATLLRGALAAVDGVARRAAATVDRGAAAGTGLDPVMPYPDVPTPLVTGLLERRPEHVLPGVGAFPLDRATLLSPDPSFVEAALLGANEELLTEFLWREFPTDRRGTPVGRFWPRAGQGTDVIPIHEWTGDLGTHATGGQPQRDGRRAAVTAAEALTVLLVRAELIRRYPGTVVVAAPAQAVDSVVRLVVPPQDQWITPVFTLAVDPSTRALAFPVDPTAVRAAPGYFFVFLEPPHGMRFGFDRTGPARMTTWNDLAWDQVVDARGFASARTVLPDPTRQPDPDLHWGGPSACSASVARIALQLPVRLAIHSSRLI